MSLNLVCRYLLKQLQSSQIDFPFFGCLAYRAVRLVRVTAIGEAALAEVGQKLGETSFYRGKIQVMQAEQLHAGTIDDSRRPDAVWRSLLVREGRLAAAPAIGRFAEMCRSRVGIQMI